MVLAPFRKRNSFNNSRKDGKCGISLVNSMFNILYNNNSNVEGIMVIWGPVVVNQTPRKPFEAQPKGTHAGGAPITPPHRVYTQWVHPFTLGVVVGEVSCCILLLGDLKRPLPFANTFTCLTPSQPERSETLPQLFSAGFWLQISCVLDGG